MCTAMDGRQNAETGISVRCYAATDLSAVRQIYRRSIVHLGSRSYSPQQVAAWAGFADDVASFDHWLRASRVVVAESADGMPIGFAGIDESGRISSLFVSPESMRQGIASTLLAHLMAGARGRGAQTLTTQASEFSRPVFEKAGFTVTEIEHTEFNGVAFERYAMRANL